jgi:hypothetical protein
MKVLGWEVALLMRSAAARGDEADFVRARKGCRGSALEGRGAQPFDGRAQTSKAFRALVCSILGVLMLKPVQLVACVAC